MPNQQEFGDIIFMEYWFITWPSLFISQYRILRRCYQGFHHL